MVSTKNSTHPFLEIYPTQSSALSQCMFGGPIQPIPNELRIASNELCLPEELQLMKKLKVYETAQEPNQLTRVTVLPAIPLMFIGKIYSGRKY